MLLRAGDQWTQPALTLLLANQRLLYFGAAIGLLAAIFTETGHRLPRQWLSWSLVAAFVYVATIWGQHVLSMPGVAGWRDFLPRSWWRSDLCVAGIGAAFVSPLVMEIGNALSLLASTLGRPRLRAHSADVDVDGAVDHEGIARADAYLAEKRKKVAAGGRSSAEWSLTPRE
jgi:hypothetical protein